MIESANGIILRTRPLTETSLIVHWLTPDFGRIATVARGARRPKSPFHGKLDLFYRADFSFSRSRSSDLHNLREVSQRETHGAIREDIFKLQQAAYATAFLEQATETETPLPEIFELTGKFLGWLCGQPPRPQNIFALELKLLHELGLEPDLAGERLTPGARQIVRMLLDGDWEKVARLKLTAAQVAELSRFLNGFLILHLGRPPLEIHFRRRSIDLHFLNRHDSQIQEKIIQRADAARGQRILMDFAGPGADVHRQPKLVLGIRSGLGPAVCVKRALDEFRRGAAGADGGVVWWRAFYFAAGSGAGQGGAAAGRR